MERIFLIHSSILCRHMDRVNVIVYPLSGVLVDGLNNETTPGLQQEGVYK